MTELLYFLDRMVEKCVTNHILLVLHIFTNCCQATHSAGVMCEIAISLQLVMSNSFIFLLLSITHVLWRKWESVKINCLRNTIVSTEISFLVYNNRLPSVHCWTFNKNKLKFFFWFWFVQNIKKKQIEYIGISPTCFPSHSFYSCLMDILHFHHTNFRISWKSWLPLHLFVNFYWYKMHLKNWKPFNIFSHLICQWEMRIYKKKIGFFSVAQS